MEKRGVSSVLKVCLVLVILVGQSTAQVVPAIIGVCYVACFVPCMIDPDTTALSCALKCLQRCILPKSTVGGVKDTQSFCKLGCATALCSNLSTKEDPAEQKVGSCVNSCSATCAKKN
ncbi:thionin-like protein 2 [Herrania umbratica]|uniref:Thionin-like protein 2 n=1 Tax=Herrania umbratica TaxID=108875 RepID=A0A6J1BI36_9ROSI|nr:thionin-like protein 2 [Herrania umbratica]